MHLQLHPFSIPFFIAALVSLFFTAVVWARRSALGAIPLLGYMLSLLVWTGASGLMWVSSDLHDQFFWMKVSTMGLLPIPAFFLLFSLQLAHVEKPIPGLLTLLLAVEPVLGAALVWSNDLHHLVFGEPQLWMTNGMAGMQWNPGPLVAVEAFYSYALMTAGFMVLVRSRKRGGHLMREQLNAILLGTAISLGADVGFLIPILSSHAGMNGTAIFYTLASAFYIYAISQKRLFDLIPVAHSVLIKSMTDSVVVVDVQDRIVELNPAAGEFLGVKPEEVVGRPARQILSNWREITQPYVSEANARTEMMINQTPPRYIDVSTVPLTDSKKRSIGQMLVFRDITERKQHEAMLKENNRRLNEQLEQIRLLRDQLREQASRDPLTNLYNRRYLENALSQELARASRENYPVCIIMLDIDRFKNVNDSCGHKAGDDVLQALAALITRHIRVFDSACRYGGEEFVIVMPKLTIETAFERAEFLRQEFERLSLPCGQMIASPTLSLGLAMYPTDGRTGEHLLNAADRALYAAKGAGRNRVVVFSQMEAGKPLSGRKSTR